MFHVELILNGSSVGLLWVFFESILPLVGSVIPSFVDRWFFGGPFLIRSSVFFLSSFRVFVGVLLVHSSVGPRCFGDPSIGFFRCVGLPC